MSDIDISVKNFVKINLVFAQLFDRGLYGGKAHIDPDMLQELGKYADGVPKGTKIVPVVTLVFYTGKEPWDGSKSIYDMLDMPEDMKEFLKETVPDYRMNLFGHMSYEEIDRFEGDLKCSC